MARSTPEDDFNIEVLKLMLQAAWSDGGVDPREQELILGAARSWGVPEREVAALERGMKDDTPPAPDLALLRDRADEALEAVRALIASDGRSDPAEQELLEELRIILSPAS